MSVTWPPLIERDPAFAARPMSVDEWMDLPEDEEGELVEGRLVEEEVPDAVLELTVSWFIGVLRVWLGPAGFVFTSELKTLTAGANRPKAGRDRVPGWPSSSPASWRRSYFEPRMRTTKPASMNVASRSTRRT